MLRGDFIFSYLELEIWVGLSDPALKQPQVPRLNYARILTQKIRRANQN
jgi:hypothetical protein